MRDKLKDKNYFESLINSRYKSMEKSLSMLNTGLIKDDRILSVKKMMTYDCLQIIGAKYSIGTASYEELKNDICNGIQLLNEAIIESWVFGHQLGITDVTNLATQYGWNF